MIVYMSILEGYSIHSCMDFMKYFIPLGFMFFQGDSIRLGELCRGRHHGFFAIYPWGNECGQVATHPFTLFTQNTKCSRSTFSLSTDFHTEIPACKTRIVTISTPHLVDNIAVGINFMLHISRIPILTAVIQTEIKFKTMLLCQLEKHLHQVYRWLIAS